MYQEASDGVPLSVTWPLDTAAYANSTIDKHVIGKRTVAASLNYSVKVILAGKGNLNMCYHALSCDTWHTFVKN